MKESSHTFLPYSSIHVKLKGVIWEKKKKSTRHRHMQGFNPDACRVMVGLITAECDPRRSRTDYPRCCRKGFRACPSMAATSAAGMSSWSHWCRLWCKNCKNCKKKVKYEVHVANVSVCVFVSVRWQAAGLKPSLLSAGRHQSRRIMCNYNRQSKTKPFT